MPVHGMNHFTILTDDLPATVDFYRKVMGMRPGPRPPFDFPGAWLYAEAGADAILHVIAGRSRDQMKAGVIDHMAFTGSGLRETLSVLESNGIEFTLRRQAGDGPWQLFFFDPNGARVEVDFDASESRT